MSLLEFVLLAPVSLFLIINPLSTVPIFISITPGESAAERSRKALFACAFSAGLLMIIALVGKWVFAMMGITIPAFQIAGGIVLSLIALDMLRAPRQERLTPEEKNFAADKEDVTIVPLTLPLLCGPGAITTAILLESQATGLTQTLILHLSIIAVYGACFLVLLASARGAHRLPPLALHILRRLSGLLFLTVAVQFVLNALIQLGVITTPATLAALNVFPHLTGQ